MYKWVGLERADLLRLKLSPNYFQAKKNRPRFEKMGRASWGPNPLTVLLLGIPVIVQQYNSSRSSIIITAPHRTATLEHSGCDSLF